jgi:TAZ zinc finger
MQWQSSEKDLDIRRKMIQTIITLMKEAPDGILDKYKSNLPDVARRLEDRLYRLANSRDVYMDISTLKPRLISLRETLVDAKHSPAVEFPTAKIETKEPIAKIAPISTSSEAKQTERETDRAKVLHQQQQRLLLLRHASKCEAATGQCTITIHCDQLKDLWKHIGKCKDKDCKMLHCVSSRFVLSHYHRCKDLACVVCSPIRKIINPSNTNAMDEAITAMRADEQVQMTSRTKEASVLTKRDHAENPIVPTTPVTKGPANPMSEEQLQKWVPVYAHCIQCMRSDSPCTLPSTDPDLKFGKPECINMKNLFIHKGTCTVSSNCSGCLNMTNLANLYRKNFILNTD